MKTNGLPEGYPETVCLMGHGALCCSFLVVGPGGLECAKLTPFEGMIRERRAEGSMRAMADNCSGPPDFRPTSEAQS